MGVLLGSGHNVIFERNKHWFLLYSGNFTARIVVKKILL